MKPGAAAERPLEEPARQAVRRPAPAGPDVHRAAQEQCLAAFCRQRLPLCPPSFLSEVGADVSTQPSGPTGAAGKG